MSVRRKRLRASKRFDALKREIISKRTKKPLRDDPFKFITVRDVMHGQNNKHISKRDCNGMRYVMNQLRFS